MVNINDLARLRDHSIVTVAQWIASTAAMAVERGTSYGTTAAIDPQGSWDLDLGRGQRLCERSNPLH